jgi:L-aminopeptidase/D-esterase-like protein
MGEAAAAAAGAGPVAEGCVGAGTGATLGKALGMKQAMKSGIGSFTVELPAGVLVSALAAVNAYGDVIDPATGRIVAGARLSPDSMEFAGTEQIVRSRGLVGGLNRENTTLAVVATNAALDKVQCGRLASFAHQGLVRAVRPVHTLMDGDIAFALSSGDRRAPFDALALAAAEAVAQAILRAVRLARTMGGLPGLQGA